MDQQPIFDLDAMLKDDGLTLLDSEGNNQYRVQDAEGQIHLFDLNAMLKDDGLDPSRVRVQANTPDTPTAVSPVGIVDRLRMSFGNTEGRIAALKKEYPSARLNSNKELVVNVNGVWQAVDAAGLGDGDGWDVTKELIKDTADLADVAVEGVAQTASAALGGIIGAAAGAPASVPGVAAGAATGATYGSRIGAGLGSGTNIFLGRMLGTYEGDASEIVTDIGLDMLLNFGGEKVVAGIKDAVIPALKNSLKWIGENTSAASKSLLASMLKLTTGVREESATRAFDRAPQMSRAIEAMRTTAKAGLENAGKAGAPLTDEVILNSSKANLTRDAAEMAATYNQKLATKYNQLRAQTLASVDDSHIFDVAQPLKDGLAELSSIGIVRSQLSRNGSTEFLPVSPADLANQLGVPPSVAKSIAPKLAKWVTDANALLRRSPGELAGKEGAEAVLQMRRSLDDSYYAIIEGSPQLERILTPITSKIRQGVDGQIKGEGAGAVASLFKGLDNFYTQGLQVGKIIGAASRNPESFVDGLLRADIAQNQTNKAAVAFLKQLDPSSAEKVEFFLDKVAATDFLRTVPKGAIGTIPRLGIIGGAAAAGGMYGGEGTMGAAGTAALLMTSPRAAFGALRASSRLTGMSQEAAATALQPLRMVANTVKSMSPDAVKTLVRDERALGFLLNQTIQTIDQDSALKQQLGLTNGQ